MTPATRHDQTPATSSADPVVLRVTGLTKSYGRARGPALDAVDLSVSSGEIFGLLGPNGAGKTTAIAVMSTLLRPDAGRVVICGLDMSRHIRRIRRIIGVVPQNVALYERLSAWENLRYFGTLYGLRGKALREAVEEGLNLAQMAGRADDPLTTLSGGMKRRINLAAGIIHRPKLLFLDEPTVGVDAQSRNLIFETLLRLKDQGMTMIYTTHYFEEAELLCSHIAVLDKGRILVQGRGVQLVADHDDCDNLSQLFLKLTGRELRD